MISPEDREKMRTVMGFQYANRVKEILAERGIRNSEGKEHDNVMISHIFHGRRNNPIIEDAIRAAYLRAKESLETKKPEAVTPGFSK